MNKINRCLQDLKAKNEKAIIPFLMGGMPDENLSLALINAAIQGGADIIEIGVPYTDPIADGPVIETYHHAGIKKGLNLSRILELIGIIRETSSIPIALFSYYNPIYKMGVTKFFEECILKKIDSVIIPDIPLEELMLLKETGLDLIPLVAPSSTTNRLEILTNIEASFVYAASVSGITGVRNLATEDIKNYLTKIRQYTNLPIALGFGISKLEHIKELKNYADAFVIGSHLVNIIKANQNNQNKMLIEIENEIKNFKMATK